MISKDEHGMSAFNCDIAQACFQIFIPQKHEDRKYAIMLLHLY